MAKITIPRNEPSKYWIERMKRESDLLTDMSIEEAEAWLAEYYLELSERLLDKIEKYYYKILSDQEGSAIVSHKMDFNKYMDLLADVQKEMAKLGNTEIAGFEKRFVELYKQNSKLIDGYLQINPKLDTKEVLKAVNRIWCQDGKMWQERVQLHTNQFQLQLMNTLGDAISSGASVEELTTRLKNDLNINWYDARRIARTELSHIQNQSSNDRYKDAGITHYKWVAGSNKEWEVKMTDKQIANLREGSYIKNKLSRNRKGDKTISIKVCELCQELDGQIFPIDDMMHIPPDGSHPNCRCTIVPVID